jgi:hypothetical protein
MKKLKASQDGMTLSVLLEMRSCMKVLAWPSFVFDCHVHRPDGEGEVTQQILDLLWTFGEGQVR